ncbi:hypothetical protein JHK87_042954 [Glycine soja]|nr:hypothetical protein JHK87_042954 [Glycine soja]
MDSEPKRWRLLWSYQGMVVVSARATRLPIYSSFAKEGNLGDLFAKGEAFSTLFNVIGIGVGIQLASTIRASMQGKFHHTSNPNRVSFKCSKLYDCAKNMGADTTKFKEGHHKALLPQRLCIRKKGRKEHDLEADPQR